MSVERALQEVTALLDQARAITRSAPGQLMAEAVARMSEQQLRADPVLATAFQRGWDARTADLQRALQTPAPVEHCTVPQIHHTRQQRAPQQSVQLKQAEQRPTPHPAFPHQQQRPSGTILAPVQRPEPLLTIQTAAPHPRPGTDPHPPTTEWTGMTDRQPRVFLPAPTPSITAPTTRSKPLSEAALARRKRNFAKLSEKQKAKKKAARSQQFQQQANSPPVDGFYGVDGGRPVDAQDQHHWSKRARGTFRPRADRGGVGEERSIRRRPTVYPKTITSGRPLHQ